MNGQADWQIFRVSRRAPATLHAWCFEASARPLHVPARGDSAGQIEYASLSFSQDPFSRALGEIRSRMRSGALVQGEQLQVANLAKALRLSATPVREALSRLAGEGAVEDRRGAGHFAPRLDAVDLADLYDLSWTYVAAALSSRSDRATAPQGSVVEEALAQGAAHLDPVGRTEALFDLVALQSRSPALRRAQASLFDRLAAVRRIEPLVLRGAEQELAALEAMMTTSGADLHDGFAAYHDRRRRASAGLIEALRSHAARLRIL